MPASAAIIIELAPDETNVAHEVEFDVIHLETAAKVMRVNAGFRAHPNAMALAGDFFQIPFAVDLRGVQIAHWGTHDAVVRINSAEVSRLTFRVHSMPTPDAQH